jgi:hypothetical protein
MGGAIDCYIPMKVGRCGNGDGIDAVAYEIAGIGERGATE